MIARMILGAGLAVGLLTQAATAADAPKLVISYSQRSPDQLPLYAAEDGGYFKQHGLDVSEEFVAAQEGIPALMNGQVQFSSIGAGDALAAAAQGIRLKYVAAFAPFFAFELWARPDHATAATLKGQKVGVPSVTGTAYVATVLALKQLDLAPGDVIMTPLGSAQNTAAALLAGSIAAYTSIPPQTDGFKDHGFVEMVDLLPQRIPNLAAGLVALDSYIAAHRDIVQAAVDAFAEGMQRYKTDKAFAEQVIAQRLGVKGDAALDQMYDFYRAAIVQDWPRPEPTMLASAQGILAQHNPKIKTVDVAGMIDTRFVDDTIARLSK